MLDRRSFLSTGTLGVLASAFAPRIAFARAATDKRFVFIIQRGAADGLGTIGAVGDPAFAGVRGDLAADFATGAKLDGMFTLHPAMTASAGLYKQGHALFAHAIASPYRDRSHFDGQNVLETGGASAYQVRDGWLNRLLGVLPADEARAIAVAATVPMALRGRREVASYAPSSLPDASDDLLQRVAMLYEGDQQLHGLWNEAMATRQLTSDLAQDGGRNAAATGALAARLLKPDTGARIAMIATIASRPFNCAVRRPRWPVCVSQPPVSIIAIRAPFAGAISRAASAPVAAAFAPPPAARSPVNARVPIASLHKA